LVLLGGGRGEDGGGRSSRGSDFDQSGESGFDSAPGRTTEITDDDIPF
jgi:hypothetical protein